MTSTDPMNTEHPWGDLRLPPVVIEIPEPASPWWPGRRKAAFLNAGLTSKQVGPLLVPKAMPGTRLQWLSAWFAAAGFALLTAATFGVVGVTTLGAMFLLGSCASVGFFALEVRAYRESGNLWDKVRDFVFSVHGDKLINLGAIPTINARRDINAYVINLAAARESILRNHAGDGPVAGEAELLHALAAVGEYARHLQDDPHALGDLGYADVADTQEEARTAALDAMTAFRELDPIGGALLDAVELARDHK
jgi:hypothetical protein